MVPALPAGPQRGAPKGPRRGCPRSGSHLGLLRGFPAASAMDPEGRRPREVPKWPVNVCRGASGRSGPPVVGRSSAVPGPGEPCPGCRDVRVGAVQGGSRARGAWGGNLAKGGRQGEDPVPRRRPFARINGRLPVESMALFDREVGKFSSTWDRYRPQEQLRDQVQGPRGLKVVSVKAGKRVRGRRVRGPEDRAVGEEAVAGGTTRLR